MLCSRKSVEKPTLAFVLALAFSGRVRPRVDVFLDKCCIHQVDEELKGHGIRAIPEVLRRSDSLLLVYTEDYFRRRATVGYGCLRG